MVITSMKKASTRGKGRFKHIPQHLWTEIFAQLASQSISALFNVKLSSKSFLEAASEDKVFEHATLKNFPVFFNNSSASSFFKRCKDSGNPEALFRHGASEYFDRLRIELGLGYLSKAADKGSMTAKYVYGIILICHGGKDKEEGLKLLSSLTSSESKSIHSVIQECRKETKRALEGMWLNNKLLEIDARNFKGHLKYCSCTEKRMTTHLGRISAWDFEDYHEGLYNSTTSCESCLWDNEVIRFCHMLKTGYFKII